MYIRSLPFIALLGLSACAMPSLDSLTGAKKPTTMASATGSGVKQDPMRLDTIAFADAYCRKDGKGAVAASQKLVVAHPNHPRALLNYGLALDLAGRGVSSYQVLDRLAKANHGMPAVLRCGQDFVYSGTVTEVAHRRRFDIKTRLAALGLAMPLLAPKETQAGSRTIYRLAALAPAPEETPPEVVSKPAPEMSHSAPPKPQKVHSKPVKPSMKTSIKTPKPGHFVHLGSYRSSKNLDRGWHSLRKRFGKILGNQAKFVSKINLGKKKGRYLRLGLKVADAKAARAMCKRLKAGGQYCVVRRAKKS